MKKSKTAAILLTDDVSPELERQKRSQAVKTCAARLAQRLGASIDLVHVEDLSFYPVVATPRYKPVMDRHFTRQKAQLAEFAESIQVPTRAILLNGDPVKKIVALGAKKGAYELIAVGTQGRTGMNRLILGSVAEEIIRHATIPVMTVGPKAQEAASGFLPSGGRLKLLVPTGLTPNSERAEDYAVKLAKRLGAELVLFHSLRDSLHPVLEAALAAPGGAQELGGLLEQLRTEAQKGLKARAARLGKGKVPVSFILDEKASFSTEAVLKEAASTSASLIVMGTHGRSLAAGAFFGRTARGVILDSPVPVITVRSRKQ